MSVKNKVILLATGGTGGHIFPALQLMETLKQKGFSVKITGDKKFAKFHPFDQEHIYIPSGNFANKSPLSIIKTSIIIFLGLIKAFLLMIVFKPDTVIGFGGYATFPTMIAATILRKKIILHEANIFLGKVNKIFVPYAQYLTTGFDKLFGIDNKYSTKIIYTGNPIRNEISMCSNKPDDSRFTILAIGGSQGAKIFSSLIPQALINLPEELRQKLYIYQQVRDEDIQKITELYTKYKISCEIKSFFTDIASKYTQANLVIARSGASTISELISLGIPAIFIPYPTAADNHQLLNAKQLADIKSGWLVQENQYSTSQITSIIKEIFRSPNLLAEYKNNLQKLQKDSLNILLSLID